MPDHIQMGKVMSVDLMRSEIAIRVNRKTIIVPLSASPYQLHEQSLCLVMEIAESKYHVVPMLSQHFKLAPVKVLGLDQLEVSIRLPDGEQRVVESVPEDIEKFKVGELAIGFFQKDTVALVAPAYQFELASSSVWEEFIKYYTRKSYGKAA